MLDNIWGVHDPKHRMIKDDTSFRIEYVGTSDRRNEQSISKRIDFKEATIYVENRTGKIENWYKKNGVGMFDQAGA